MRLTGIHKSGLPCGRLLKLERSTHFRQFQPVRALEVPNDGSESGSGHGVRPKGTVVMSLQRLDQKAWQLYTVRKPLSLDDALCSGCRKSHVGSVRCATMPMRKCSQGECCQGCCRYIPSESRTDGSTRWRQETMSV